MVYLATMKVLIFGAGRRGLRIAKHLIEEGKSITFLDYSTERCQSAQSKLDCMAICGSATNIDKLIEAGAEEADIVIAVTDSDEVNIVSCGLVAANFPNVTNTIAAIRSISYTGPEGISGKILGINHIVNPDQEGATRIADIIKSGLYQDTITFPDTDFELFTNDVDRNSPYCNKSLIEIRKNSSYNFVVAGVQRKGRTLIPAGDTIIKQGDTLAMISDNDETYAILNHSNKIQKYKQPDSIIIIGATRVTRFLLQTFSAQDRKKVKLIEKNAAIATEFATLFPEILVLNAAITDEQIWEEENLDKSDLFISLTENDELNIITASYAKKIGAKKAIALIKTNTNYSQFALSLDVDVALSITDVTVDSLVKNLRGDGVSAMHTLFNGGLEVYEYVVQEEFKYLGKALKDVNLRNKIIIAGVKRADGSSMVPGGNYVFSLHDSLILAVTHENSDYIQEFFA